MIVKGRELRTIFDALPLKDLLAMGGLYDFESSCQKLHDLKSYQLRNVHKFNGISLIWINIVFDIKDTCVM